MMKRMTCSQLGGACETEFYAETFEDMAEQSKQHSIEMFKAKDSAHIAAMETMKDLMIDPNEMKRWMNNKRSEFEQLIQE